MSLVERAERYFEFAALRTNWKTELLAGATTFITISYFVFVNSSILQEDGMPAAGVTAATCLAAAIGCLLMGAFARYPIALAPGMGLNAYFTYSVVKGMGIDWQVALGAVFLSGVAFLLLTAAGIRQMIVNSIPHELYSAVAAGVGLFIALIGFRNAGIVVANQSTVVALGDMRNPTTQLALFGLLVMAVLLCAGWKAAILIGRGRDLDTRRGHRDDSLAAAAVQRSRYRRNRLATGCSRGHAPRPSRHRLRLSVCGSVRQRRDTTGSRQEGRLV